VDGQNQRLHVATVVSNQKFGETKLKILALHWPSVAQNSRSLVGRSGEICATVLLGFFPVAKLPPRLYSRGGYN